jgi:two-component system cell cycle response regulator DivK
MMKNWIVIIVEDTYDDMQLATAVLEYDGIEVQVAHNGNECLQLLQSVKPTLIVTDLAMPEMDGWQLLDAIRANPKTAHIPVVAVSAYYSADVARDANSAGFDACFAKPISPREFVNQLDSIINQHE